MGNNRHVKWETAFEFTASLTKAENKMADNCLKVFSSLMYLALLSASNWFNLKKSFISNYTLRL